jgi:hypothetical protein
VRLRIKEFDHTELYTSRGINQPLRTTLLRDSITLCDLSIFYFHLLYFIYFIVNFQIGIILFQQEFFAPSKIISNKFNIVSGLEVKSYNLDSTIHLLLENKSL